MTHVITEPCIGVKEAACVAVCPVDCIHPSVDDLCHAQEDMLYINPATCIDCGLCVDECPVQAIYHEGEIPEQWRRYIRINAEYYERLAGPNTARKQAAP